MRGEKQNMLSHVSIGTADFDKATAFYDRVLATLGCRRMMDLPDAVAYGRSFPEFWVQLPLDGQPANTGNGIHFGFSAESKQAVDNFFQAAIAAGGTDDGAPGPRPAYGPAYYGCFVRDLDGHKIEAMYWEMGLARLATG